jgi:hypothetical protein
MTGNGPKRFGIPSRAGDDARRYRRAAIAADREVAEFEMNTISEYEQRAEECREMARGAGTPAHRERLLKTAQTWAGLAEALKKKLAEQGRTVEG